jgi:PAS domain S-box-containing protein
MIAASQEIRATASTVVSVLLIEDNAADARLVTEYLTGPKPARFRVTHATHLRRAIECLEREGFHAIVLDLGLPDSQGLETLLQARAGAPGAPIIVLTGTDDERTGIAAVQSGAQDYLVKGAVTGDLLRQALSFAIERGQIEAALRDREERFRQLTDNMAEVFFVVDVDFHEVLYISPGYEIVWGRSCATMFERPASFMDAIVPQDRDTVAQNIHAVRRGEAGDVVYRIARPDGEIRWIHSHNVPVRESAGRIYRIAGVSMDITEQRNLERQFRQAQKMEAVGRLAGGVAHDFNNLLTVISSYTSLLLSEHSHSAPIREDLNEIAKAADSAAMLTRQLLAFSRQQVLEPRSLDLNDVVQRAEKMLRRVIGEDVELRTWLDPELASTRADAGQLEQVIMNMAVNARDAMPDGGSILLATSNVTVGDTIDGESFAAAPGAYVLLAITDSGSGMDEDTRNRIFEPFFTTKEPGKGTGLGLAMVYGIVKQSGGYISVQSAPGRGTTFKIYLPVVPFSNDPVHVPAPGEFMRGTETILLVEDVAALRDIGRRVLERQGYTVLDASDSAEALAAAAAHDGPIHLLLTDVVLPGAGGRQLADLLKASRPQIRVLFTSGYTDDAVVRGGVFDSGVAFLQKPFAPETLARKVREVLD